ncbi:DNA damage-binding protein 1 [Trichuris trichiura]|uniref:DNA damage-binding protein 1 n=1 Tax=Trichuris trichiura TaxID=36087 RepID=A0A077ZAC0_TRITR|nr:DNA damage-binding protein 1 [Trichuris trichiura]
MSYNYVVTAHPSTAVTLALSGNFTSPDSVDLLMFKTNRFEVFTVCGNRLNLRQTVKLHARIAAATLFVAEGSEPLQASIQNVLQEVQCENKSCLAIATLKNEFLILEYADDQVRTIGKKIFGEYTTSFYSPMILIWDPAHYVFGLAFCEAKFRLIKWRRGGDNEITMNSFMISEDSIVDMTFLPCYEKPTIAMLHCDNFGRRIQTHVVDENQQELQEGPWKKDGVELEAVSILAIPPPELGVLVLSTESVIYLNEITGCHYVGPLNQYRAPYTSSVFVIEPRRFYMFGDVLGHIFLVTLNCVEDRCTGIDVECLFKASAPESICYLGNGLLFIGSRLGDSYLLNIMDDTNTINPDCVKVIEEFSNLGPIVDMLLVDLEYQEQKQIVVCTGHPGGGSLHVVSSGICVKELFQAKLPGVMALWALSYLTENSSNNLCLVSFMKHTKTLMFRENEIEEIEIAGIALDDRTHCAANVGDIKNNQIVQVTPGCVRLVDATSDGHLISFWEEESDDPINMAACNSSSGQIVIAIRNKLVYLVVSDDHLRETGSTCFDSEISCLDISFAPSGSSEIACVSLWVDICVLLIHLPTMTVLKKQRLDSEFMARSILLARLQDTLNLFVGMGDGNLIMYDVDERNCDLLNRWSVSVGRCPVSLKVFRSKIIETVQGSGVSTCKNANYIMVCSDRYSVVYANNDKLLFSSVNIRDVLCISPLNSEAYEQGCVFTNGEMLSFGVLDNVQRLHVRRVPLAEFPRRIAQQVETSTYGVITVRCDDGYGNKRYLNELEMTPASEMAFQQSKAAPNALELISSKNDFYSYKKISSFLIMDRNNFDVLYSYSFGTDEECCALTSCHLGHKKNPLYVVGTAFNIREGDCAIVVQGRLLVLEYNRQNSSKEGSLSLLCCNYVNGTPEAIIGYHRKLLVLVKENLCLYEFKEDEETSELIQLASYTSFVSLLFVKVRGDLIMCGDLQHSITILSHEDGSSEFNLIAKDYYPKWLTAIAFVNDREYLLADTFFNFCYCECSGKRPIPDGGELIKASGYFHLGEFVNCIERGWIVLQNFKALCKPLSPPMVYGTAEGSLGVVCQISEEHFKILDTLQKRIIRMLPSAGGLNHGRWRAFESCSTRHSVERFVDGDVIESFLTFPKDIVAKLFAEVARQLNLDDPSFLLSGAKVLEIAEDLSKIH